MGFWGYTRILGILGGISMGIYREGDKWMYNFMQRSVQVHGEVARGDLRFHVV